MRRYKFVSRENIFGALNKLRASFLAAKDGSEVEEIITGVLTYDERLKIGRRLQIARMLRDDKTYSEIHEELKVGGATINLVEKLISNHPRCFELINKREEKVETEFKNRAFEKVGSHKRIFRPTIYTGFRKKDVTR
jgi:uncharacterized protein YerC